MFGISVEKINKNLTIPVGALLGGDILKHFIIDFDYKNSKIIFHSKSKLDPSLV